MTDHIESLRDALAAADNMLAHGKATMPAADYKQRSDVLAKAREALTALGGGDKQCEPQTFRIIQPVEIIMNIEAPTLREALEQAARYRDEHTMADYMNSAADYLMLDPRLDDSE